MVVPCLPRPVRMSILATAVLVLGVAVAPVSAAAETSAPAKHAPDRPPLATGTGSSGAGTGSRGTAAEEASASAPVSGGDPLQSNGLNSPLCRDAAGELAGAAARDCRASGFEGAQAPTGDYGLDVHISTGLTHLGIGNDVSAIVQELLQIWWTAMVAVVRGVIVVLDWCYTLDLLNSPAMSGVAQGLRETQATFTEPWMAIVLSIAAVAALYHGLIRRRVAQTLGEALVMVAMMAGGLWVIASPTHTIGALGAWANEASLGTLAAVRAGSAEHPYRTLAESDRELFGAAINAPWCFVEFGDVGWCDAPVEPRLRKAALKLAAHAKPGAEGVSKGSSSLPLKAVEDSIELVEGAMGAGEEVETIHISPQSAALLRSARTNGELFLALPANGPARNSLSNNQSLFAVLCGGGEEPCSGPTAGEAEFRTSSGTWSRAIGMTLVAFGVLGMLLLLGFIAWRLLYAAFMSLVYLLLTPAAVLAPALGENGRSAFRTWGMRLLAAVTSKLIYSFLLGAVLMVERVLADVRLFGWLTQWLLLSSLWWIVYLRRNRLFEFATGGARGGAAGAQQRSVLRRVSDVLESRKGVSATRWAKRRLSKPAPSVDRRRRTVAQAGRERAQGIADEQVKRSLERDYDEAQTVVAQAPEIEERIAANRDRLQELQGGYATARAKADGARRAEKAALTDRKVKSSLDRKRNAAPFGAEVESQQGRAAELHEQMGRLRSEIAADRESVDASSQTVREGDRVKQRTGELFTRAQAEQRGRFLDAQAALPAKERDYARLAALTQHGRRGYEALDEHRQREARLEMDRELATRRGAAVAAREISAGEEGSLNLREQQDLNRRFDGTLEQAVKAEGHDLPAELRPQSRRSRADAPRHRGSGGGGSGGAASKSSVMRDLHEAQARHKRQLGSGRR